MNCAAPLALRRQHLRAQAGCGLALGLGLFMPGFAAAMTVEERLQQLETAVEELQRENAELRKQLGSAAPGAKPAAAQPASAASPATVEAPPVSAALANAADEASGSLSFGGFVQGQAEFGDAGDQRFAGLNDRIFIRRARVNLRGSFTEHFDFRIDAELGAGSVAGSSNLRVQGNEIYVNWNRYPAANLRIGQIKPAFGYEQLSSDASAYTMERSLGSDRIADGRQPSVGIYGSFPRLRLGYTVTVGNGTGSNTSVNDNDNFLLAARLYGTLFDAPGFGKLDAGINLASSEDDGISKPGFGFDSVAGGPIDNLFFGKRRSWGVDGQWQLGRLELSAELLRSRFEPLLELPAATLDASSWQITAAWYLLPSQLQAVLRREVFDPDRDLSGDATSNWTAGLNYFIRGDHVRLMLNYLFGDAPDLPDDSGRWLARVRVVF